MKICLRRGKPQPPLLEVREMATNKVVRRHHIAMDAAAGSIQKWMHEEVQRENGGAVGCVPQLHARGARAVLHRKFDVCWM
jgi:hypothetical protein